MARPTTPVADFARVAWRAACTAQGLQGVLDELVPGLRRAYGVEAGAMLAFDFERHRVDRSAAFGRDFEGISRRAELDGAGLERLLAWCAQRGAVSQRADAPREIAPRDSREFLAAPIRSGDDVLGALILVPRSARDVPRARAAVQILLEPLAAAVGHERRVHELSRLREAAEAENRALRTRLGRNDISASIVGAERGLRDVMERVVKVAVTDAPVLILGETGSGKEVIARAIHERSTRATGPIVRVNCGAIAPELVDSELFGHERGSFTGATGTHRGWFERADGGTLFLDEIAELAPSVQVRLLRVLQDGTYQRVGGQRAQSCDVRLVAATHRNLEEMVAARAFRQDLWYRIGVFPIRLPSLRERPQDVPDLATHFAIAAGKRLGAGALVPTLEDVELLVAYDWPGNVRELAAVIERAAILGDGKRLDVRGALGSGPTKRTESPREVVIPVPGELAGAALLNDDRTALAESTLARFASLSDSQRAHVERALEATRGRIEGPHGAARLLGINPHTLRSRMRKLSLDWRAYRAPRL